MDDNALLGGFSHDHCLLDFFQLAATYYCTVPLSTPTLLRTYVRLTETILGCNALLAPDLLLDALPRVEHVMV